jgi:hypothetical protein
VFRVPTFKPDHIEDANLFRIDSHVTKGFIYLALNTGNKSEIHTYDLRKISNTNQFVTEAE